MNEQPICRRCGRLVEGDAGFDPRPHDGPSYLHPACVKAEREDMEIERWRVEKAAPYLLAACERYEAALVALLKGVPGASAPLPVAMLVIEAREKGRAAAARARGVDPDAPTPPLPLRPVPKVNITDGAPSEDHVRKMRGAGE